MVRRFQVFQRMKNNGRANVMNTEKKLIPLLRFSAFIGDGEWENVKLGDCLLQTPDYGLNAPAVPYSESLPTYLRITDITDSGKFDKSHLVSVNAELSSENSLQEGDLVVARTGASVGKVYKYRKEDGPLVFAGFLIRLRPNPNRCNSEYLFQYMLSPSYKRWVNITSTRSGQPGINSTEYASLSVPFPQKLPEQQKIADCLSSIDSYISSVNEKIEQLKAHKKSLMQKLFPQNGQTVPEYRFPEFKKNGAWEEDTMENIFDIKNGYTPSKSNPQFWEGGTIPWFRMEDIRKNGHILSDSIQHITPNAVKGDGLFPAYSIILATTATIGEHALIIVDSLANQQFTFLTKRESFDSKLDMLYFHYYMFIIDEWCKQNTNSGGLLSVNMPAFKQLIVPFPQPTEQKKIAECLSSIDKTIIFYAQKASLLEQQKAGLIQQLFPQL